MRDGDLNDPLLGEKKEEDKSTSDNESSDSSQSLSQCSSEEKSQETPIETPSIRGQRRGDNNDSRADTDLMDTAEVDKLLGKASAITFVVWLLFLTTVYLLAPSENVVYLDGAERRAASFAFFVLIIALIMSALPYAVGFQGRRFSGILAASTVVQVVSMITNALLAWGPTVVYTDKVTHSRAFLMRYCEWTPLAGFMTFLSESVDLPAERRHWTGPPLITSLLQLVSAGSGLVLPLCPGPVTWTMMMSLSCMTYSFMFPRVFTRRRNLERLACGLTAVEIEHSERRVFAYRLMTACTVTWSTLVVMYFVNMAIHRFTPEDHPIRIPGLAMIFDTIFDLIAKVIYIKLIVSVHEAVFDESGRARRRLKELRHMLSVLWESSSDVIVISVRGRRGEVSTMLSPTYTSLLGTKWPNQSVRRALVVELKEEINVDDKHKTEVGSVFMSVTRAYFVDVELPFDVNESEETLAVDVDDHFVTEALRIIRATWNCDGNDTLLLQDLVKSDGVVAKCEVKVTTRTDSAAIAMVRDASERYRLAEAEQRAVLETIARQKDAQAVNRFTRHEVKNGLLASIELCESLRASLKEVNKNRCSGDESDASNARVEELGTALHEILDTVLAEAMARDVIHGVYQPKLERIDVLAQLSSAVYDMGKVDRFKILVHPSNLSFLRLDPQLLKYIHRNAISNACKYGMRNGQITTEISYVEEDTAFVLTVTNLPGANHEELVAMGEEAESAVFLQGKRLHAQLDMEGSAAVVSTGDGAWIMNKCAKTLGGTCSIRFLRDKTIFTFKCPTEHFSDLNEPLLPWGEPSKFEVPKGTWGVAVDDSRIQRKLLSRILSHGGVDKEHMLILGATADEIKNLCVSIRDVVRSNPKSHVLILMDENLDIVEEGKETLLSGSSCLEELLTSLDKSEESRVLALVRSANDSGEDVNVYASRSHGFFPKAPMKRERVREILSALWAERFLKVPANNTSKAMEDARQETAESLALAEKLVSEGVTQSRWPRIWKALERLKGNLVAHNWSAKTASVVELINNMDSASVPSEFGKKWGTIRDTIVEYVSKEKPGVREVQREGRISSQPTK